MLREELLRGTLRQRCADEEECAMSVYNGSNSTGEVSHHAHCLLPIWMNADRALRAVLPLTSLLG
jgi:hypothetical protein